MSEVAVTQVVARAGHGKSTFLASVADALDEADIEFRSHYLQPSLWTRLPVPEQAVQVLILDEAERLTKLNLRRLADWAGKGHRLVFSSHRDLSVGLFPLPAAVRTISLPAVSSAGLQKIFRVRLQWAGDSLGRFLLTEDAASWLKDVSGGNLRVVQATLYEAIQEIAEEATRNPQSVSQTDSFILDETRLRWLETFARRRAVDEEAGNTPFSRWRLLKQAVTAVTGRMAARLSGHVSTPDPAGPTHSRRY